MDRELLNAMEELLDRKLDEKLEEKLDEKLEEKLDEKLRPLNQTLSAVETELGMVKENLGEVKTELGMVKENLGEVKTELVTVKEDLGGVKTELTLVKISIENDISPNIMRVAEGHLDLNRKLYDALESDQEREMLALRVNYLDSEVRKIKIGESITA